ncbi:hypothetical protein COB64_01340 [Candidatus Wolfebacteria bacterium]|nr:MAG: hypothetical protein COB64_01340 [Candidatus Wolfebacteria bacterium]
MSHSWLYVVSGGFVLGVGVRSFFTIGWPFIFFIFSIALAILFYSFFIIRKESFRSGGGIVLILLSLFLYAFGFGIARFHVSDRFHGDVVLEEHVGERVTVEGIISEEPDVRDGHTKLIVDVDTFIEDTLDNEIDARIIVTTESFPSYSFGNRISVEGILKKPQNFKNEIGKEFNYVSYLAKDDIFYQIGFADIGLISTGHGNRIRRALFSLKDSFLKNTGRVIQEPENALLSGVLLGTKQSLGKNLKQDFIDTGLIHIVVLSGYNVTIVAEAIMRFFGYFLARGAALSVGVVSIILFALMTGAGATIVRASIMAILVLIARATGRTYEITRALIIAGVIMLLQNPWILIHDISFQLSFLATIGLIYLAPRFESYVKFLPKLFDIRGIFAATLATQLFVLPFILYSMGTLSLVAPVVNLLALPVIPATMLSGFITGVVGFIAPIIAVPFAWISFFFLHYIILLVEFFSNLSFASLTITSFPLILVILIYMGIGWYIFKSKVTRLA